MTSKNGNTANDTNTNPMTGLPWKRYYWSCGWCGHWGKAFPNKKEGHQDDASFKNRMGCIRKYCPWQEWGAVCKTELGYSHNSNKNTNYIYSIFQKTVALHLEPPSIMKADSGASKTYLQEKHCKYLLDQKCLEHGPETTLPDNSKIRASVQGTLPIHPELSHSALVYPTLHNESLLSIG